MNNEHICNELCVCIVTYYPKDETWKNITKIKDAVGAIVVVDNTDIPNNEYIERNINLDIVYICNNGNKGLAYALNQGLNFAISHGYKLYMTLDQDSICDISMIEKLVYSINVKEKIVSVGPCWNREVIKKNIEVKYLITSGNITTISAAKDVGGFDENLFIDSVDMDFSLALRNKGYKLLKVSDAILEHKIGEKELSVILHIPYYSHSASRMYYIYRNHIILAKKYFDKFPFFIVKLYILLAIDFIKILTLEKNKKNKIINAIRGIRDGIKIINKK